MSRQIRTGLEWLHVTLLLAPISTMLYHMIYMEEKTYDGYWLYVQAWSLLLPVILSALFIRKMKSLAGYLLAGIGVVVLVCGFHWLLGIGIRQDNALYGNVVIMGLLSFAIWVKRFSDRIRMAEDRQEENDPYWTAQASFLNKISPSGLGFLAVYYVFGICFTSRAICNIAFFSAIVYGFCLLGYRFFTDLNNYIMINRRVAGMPVKRIYGIASAMVSVLCIALVLSVIPSVMLISQRRYTDIRTWFVQKEREEVTWDLDVEHDDPPVNTDMMQFFLEEQAKEPKEMPFLVKLALYGIAAATLLYVLMAAWKEICKLFLDFRQTYDENGDKIEVIEDSAKDVVVSRRRKLQEDPQAEKIRRQYKKTIRKHRKEAPKAHETPAEMELAAGLQEDANMQQLHVSYEEVRYGDR